MTETHYPPFWAEKMLHVLGGKVNHENLRCLHAQGQAEGGTAKWNPLNSTVSIDGFTLATSYNSSGVKNYIAPVVGVCANAVVFASRLSTGALRYGGILGDFQAGTKTAEQIISDNRAEYITWAGGDANYPDLILAILKELP